MDTTRNPIDWTGRCTFSTLCDKCGEPVPDDNDAVRVHAIFNNDAILLLTAQARHFLPTDTCVGSPSRAQYIDGQPRDTRYPYVEEQEALWRAAYASLSGC